MAVIRGSRGFISASGKDEVENLGFACGPSVGARFGINLAADPEGGLADLGIGTKVAEDRGIEGAVENHHGIVPDIWLSGGFADHE